MVPLNQCGACGLDFSSLAGFDAHRVGRHEPLERRCLSTSELRAKGFAPDARGRWGKVVSPEERARLRQAFSGSGVGRTGHGSAKTTDHLTQASGALSVARESAQGVI